MIIRGVTPSAGPVRGGTKVVLTGKGFDDIGQVRYGGNPATRLHHISDSQLEAWTPAHGAGSVAIELVSRDGSQVVPTDAQFRYVEQPQIDTLTPSTGTATGGTRVTLMGAHLGGVTDVLFGDERAISVEVVSDSEVVVTTPRHSAGTVDAVALSPGGRSQPTIHTRYTYL